MPKYRKKPVVITAEQFHGIDAAAVPDGVKTLTGAQGAQSMDSCLSCGEPRWRHGTVQTAEGPLLACVGDYIITGVKGEQYPCKPDVFEQTYDLVEE